MPGGLLTICYIPDRLEHRMDLARGLESLCGELPRLRQLDIWANHSHWLKDHNFIHQDFTDEQGFDPLCEAIRKLSQPTVVKLSVEGIAISEICLRTGVNMQLVIRNPGSHCKRSLSGLV